MKTQEREARAARIEYLEEHLSKVCDLMKFVEGESPDKELGGLMFLEGGNYRPLVKLQMAILNTIESMTIERKPISVYCNHRCSLWRAIDQM